MNALFITPYCNMEYAGFREVQTVIQIPSGPSPSLVIFVSLISTCKHVDNTYYIRLFDA